MLRSLVICAAVLALPATMPQARGQAVFDAYLKASNTGIDDLFGRPVAVSGNTVVIGALDEASSATGVNGDQADNGAPDSGAVYVFVRNGTSWSQQAYLKASNTDSFDSFGSAVAVSGDTLVVGARDEASNATGVDGDQENDSANGAGAAYVFVRSGTTWSQQAYLKASNTDGGMFVGDGFGNAVAISGDTVAIAALMEDSIATGVDGDQDDNSATSAGAVYVFVRNGTTWSQQAYLKASNTSAIDVFGWSVSLSGDTLAVGASGEDSQATGVDGDQDDDSSSGAGAAYVFVRNGTVWSQQAYLKASNTESNDRFGLSVSVSGDTLAIAAPFEDSSATGVDGDQADNSASGAGAAYVFVRSDTVWSQQAYLKASNTEASDQFGLPLSLSGHAVVVAAELEDSRATGVDGDQASNDSIDSGAAYAFARNETSWSQHAFLKASNTDTDDRFGVWLAVAGDTAVVGADAEDSNATGVDGNQTDNSSTDSGAAYVFDLALGAGEWIDFGGALVGVSGSPLLVGTGTLVFGSPNAIGLSDAAPSAPCGLFVALSSTPVPFKGGTLKAFPTLLAPIILSTSPAGTLPLPFTMPAGLPPGTDLWLQYAIQDAAAVQGFALSNALVGSTP
jgi:hypothetical protein